MLIWIATPARFAEEDDPFFRGKRGLWQTKLHPEFVLGKNLGLGSDHFINAPA